MTLFLVSPHTLGARLQTCYPSRSTLWTRLKLHWEKVRYRLKDKDTDDSALVPETLYSNTRNKTDQAVADVFNARYGDYNYGLQQTLRKNVSLFQHTKVPGSMGGGKEKPLRSNRQSSTSTTGRGQPGIPGEPYCQAMAGVREDQNAVPQPGVPAQSIGNQAVNHFAKNFDSQSHRI